MVRSTLIALNTDQPPSYPFINSMNRSNGICNTLEDPFGSISVSNKMEDVNLKVFYIIKRINESRTLEKYIYRFIDVNLMVRNVT